MAFIINNDQVITDLEQGKLSELFIDGTNVLQGDGLGNVTLRNVIIDASTIDTSSLTTDDIAEGTNLYYLDSRVQTYLTTNAYATEAYVDTADANLQSQIDALIISSSGDIAQVQANLDAEIARATAAENLLQTNLDSETSSRVSADTSLQASIDAEALSRTNADIILQANIDAEETARILGDSTTLSTANAYTDNEITLLTAYIDAENAAQSATVGSLTTDDVSEGSNLYYTDSRARASISATDGITYNSTSGAFTLTNTGVTAGLYGSPTQVAQFIVDENGRLTDAGVTFVSAIQSTNYDIFTGQYTINTVDGNSYTQDLGVGINDSPTFASLTTTGNLQIDGDLIVGGSTTTINTTNLAVADNMIYLNDGSTVSNPDLGFAGNYNDGTYAHAGIFRDASDGRWKFYDGYTLEPDAAAFIDTTHASFSLADVEASAFIGTLVGNAASSSKLATARTISLGGDATGSVSFDGSANVTLSVAVVDDSHNHIIANVDGLQTALDSKSDIGHNHDDRYYTETESDARFVNVAGDNMTGYLTLSGGPTNTLHAATKGYVDAALTYVENIALTNQSDITTKLNKAGDTMTGDLTMSGVTPQILFNGTSDAGVDFAIKATPEGLDFYEPEDANKIHFQIFDDTGVNAPFGYKVGSVQIVDSAGNIKKSPTITLSGDVSGSATLTDLSSATISVTVADDSHNHIIANVDGLQTALDSKADVGHVHSYLPLSGGTLTGPLNLSANPTTDTQAANKAYVDAVGEFVQQNPVSSALKWTNARTLTLTGDVSGSVSIDGSSNVSMTTTVANDSHSHSTYLPYSGGTMSGYLTLNAGPVNALHAATKSYVDTALNQVVAGNVSSADKWTTARTITLGGDLTGSVSIDGSANVTLNAAVLDNSHLHSNYVSKSGDTMTGYLTLSSGPVNALHAATKGYADAVGNAVISDAASKYIRKDTDDTAVGIYTFSNTTNATAANTGAIRISGGMSVVGNMFVGGDVTAYSDRRVKTNLEKIDNALDKVLKLNGYTFERTDKDDDGKRYAGVIAQEVLEVLPEVVNGSEEEHYSVAYGNMVALLIEGMKEQQSQIEALKAEIQQLKDK